MEGKFSDYFNSMAHEYGVKLLYTKYKLVGKDGKELTRKLMHVGNRDDILESVQNGPYWLKDVLWMRIAEQMQRGGARRRMPYNCSVPAYFPFWPNYKPKFFMFKRKDGGYEFHGWTPNKGKE